MIRSSFKQPILTLARVSAPHFDWLALSMYMQGISWTVLGWFIPYIGGEKGDIRNWSTLKHFEKRSHPLYHVKRSQLRLYSSLITWLKLQKSITVSYCIRTAQPACQPDSRTVWRGGESERPPTLWEWANFIFRAEFSFSNTLELKNFSYNLWGPCD